jgi:hypothetical protein
MTLPQPPWRRSLVVALALASLAPTLPALAGPVRNPDAGVPAFAFDIPPGWTVSRKDATTVTIDPTEGGASLVLVMAKARSTSESAAVFGRAFLKAAGLAASGAPRRGVVAGKPGTAWLGAPRIGSNGAALQVRVTAAKIDPTDFAVAEELRPATLTPAQDAAFQRLLASVKIITEPGPSAPPFLLGRIYLCQGERLLIPHCGDAQGDTCQVSYLDRLRNGLIVQTAEHRAAIAAKLQSCEVQ